MVVLVHCEFSENIYLARGCATLLLLWTRPTLEYLINTGENKKL